MNVYDFDKTIYDGDSSVDFFKFCVKRNKKCLLILPNFVWSAILYKLNIYTKEQLKSSFFSFVKYFQNIDEIVDLFWKANKSKLKEWYIKDKRDNDLIISASPQFLLSSITRELNVDLIATDVNNKNGKLNGKNCHGEEKVRRFKEKYNEEIGMFYSDSLSDTPLKNISKKSYIIKGDRIVEWDLH